MFKLEVKTVKLLTKEIVDLSKKKAVNPLKKLGYELMRYGKALVNTSGRNASNPGEPPHKRSGKLQRSILYNVQDQTLFVGILKKAHGWYGNLLEFGGTFTVKRKGKSKGKRIGQTRTIAARPYMQPTLINNTSKIPAKFDSYLMK